MSGFGWELISPSDTAGHSVPSDGNYLPSDDGPVIWSLTSTILVIPYGIGLVALLSLLYQRDWNILSACYGITQIGCASGFYLRYLRVFYQTLHHLISGDWTTNDRTNNQDGQYVVSYSAQRDSSPVVIDEVQGTLEPNSVSRSVAVTIDDDESIESYQTAVDARCSHHVSFIAPAID